MSSTNRGYDRHKSDYYVTPQKDVELFIQKFQKVLNKDTNSMSELKWLDPCCGGDDNNDASYIEVIKNYYEPKHLLGVDIREDSKADIVGNFLEMSKEDVGERDIIISNPPFNLATEFIKKGLELVNDGGYVVMLLRLNFFGSKKRKKLWEQNMAEYCFVHHKRINFIPESMKQKFRAEGKKVPTGDSIEYAHFVWRKGKNPEFSKTFVI